VRRLLALLLALALGAAGVAGLAAPAGAATTAGAEEVDLLRLHNDARGAAGLAPLADDVVAREVARDWARELADSGRLRHNPDLVAQVDARVTRDWTRLGENVGVGSDVRALHDAFLASSPHRANILGAYNRVGVGAARDAQGRLWVALVFVQAAPIRYVPSSAWAPFANPYGFAEQQYRDFLGRAGDPAGVDHWATELRAGRAGTAAEVEAFLDSPEFGGVIAPVVRLWLGAFGRVPDTSLRAWLDRRRAGASLEALADDVAASGEFRARFDGGDERAFVDALHRAVFGRPADQAALDRWGGPLESGRMGRGGVLLAMVSTDEFVWTSASEVTVTMAYLGLLRRAPEAGGFAHWVRELDGGFPRRDLVASVLGSAEYAARF